MKTVRDYSSEKKRYAAPFYEVVKFDFSQALLEGSPAPGSTGDGIDFD